MRCGNTFSCTLINPVVQVRLPVDSRMVGMVRWRRATLGPSQRSGPSQRTSLSQEPEMRLVLLSTRQSKHDVNISHMMDYTVTYGAATLPSSLGIVMLTFFPGRWSKVTWQSAMERHKLPQICFSSWSRADTPVTMVITASTRTSFCLTSNCNGNLPDEALYYGI